MGHVARGFASYYRDEHNSLGRHHLLLRTPSDLLIFDLFVHTDLTSAMDPQFFLYSNLECGPMLPAPELERYRLPASPQVQRLGVSPPIPGTPEVARYDELVDYVFAQLGWQANEFAGFRVQMPYPPLPAAAVLEWPLAERSEGEVS
jgi:hypothetical protein